MSFFAILFALLLEQARPLSPDNAIHKGLSHWAEWVRRNLDAGQAVHGWMAWGLAVALPALLSCVIYWGIWLFSSVLAFIWLVAVLYLALGFRQFSHHFSQIRQALEAGDDALAREKLAGWLSIETGHLSRTEVLRLTIAQSVLSAHCHVLGVLVAFVVLWVLGLGPAGAVLYRLSEYLGRHWRARTDGTHSPALCAAGAQAWQWVDHVPARTTALAFAVVGNFEEAVACWRSDAARFAPGSDGVILAAAAGALHVRLAAPSPLNDAESETRPEPQLAHLSSVVGLVWRSVVLWMLLLILLTLARLVG
ncbi:MAG: hypothetical protein RLZZ352_161 [Pseudomonadota bacterium]|jgi:adenosylcobinamide-phosphate synthase